MAKVILISSRKIDTMLRNFTEESDYYFIKSSNLQECFFNDSDGLMYSVLKRDENSNQQLIGDFAAFSQMMYENIYDNEEVYYSSTNEILSERNGIKIPEEAKETILQSIRKLTGKIDAGSYGLVYEGSSMYLGKVAQLKTENSDVNLFIAHEYPHCLQNCKHSKIAYMNAIIEDIILSNESLKDAEWTFVSHDRDWLDDEVPDECNIKKNSEYDIKIPDSFRLKTIYDNENTAVFIFSHVNLDSKIYTEFISNFSEKIGDLEKFGKSLIQSIIR
jgi:hypothetical protein